MVGDLALLRRMTFKGKHKIQDHWEDTIYHVERQPNAGLSPVFRITPGGNIKGDSENERSQQDVNGCQDCILVVSDDGVPETKVVSTDPEPEGQGNAICVQCVQTTVKLNYWVKTICGWVISLYGHQ